MRRRSVRSKLFFAIFGPSVSVLLLIGIIGVLLDGYSVGRAIEREADVQAKLLALALRGPLSLGDTLALQEILDSLKGNPDILDGSVYNDQDKRVAYYPAGESPAEAPGSFSVSQQITVGNQQIGHVKLTVSLARFYTRLEWYSAAAAGSLALLSLGAAAAASLIGRRFSLPVQKLSQTARIVSEKRDYTVRAPDSDEEEFQNLSNAFNHMLEEIQEQNAALTRKNEELGRSNRELEAFTYTVSHDLRTPLRAISSYAQLLASSEVESLTPEGKMSLERIEKNAIRMARLIDDLLSFSKIDAVQISPVPVDLTRIAEEVWAEMAPDRQERDVEFRIEPLGTVVADPALMCQVFANLLGNALKYTRVRQHAVIHVGVKSRENGQRTFFVRDNGVGFDMQYAGKLFRVFERLHKQKEFEGTGVGLAIVHRIITRHGGRIWAESEPDQGACFYFELPR